LTGALTPIGGGRFVVPGNRWDLIAAGQEHLSAAAEAADQVEISVVIPFYDNQHDLDLVLAALSVQSHPASRLQVVIADDGSPEPPQVPDLAQGLDISIVRQEDRGFRAGAARNLGVARSDGDVLLFLDGDTVPSPDYVRQLGILPSVLPDAVVSGRRRYADLHDWMPSDLLTWFADRSPGPTVWDEPAWMTQEYGRTRNLLAVHPRSYQYLIGAVLGCSREMYQEIGGFDESITGYGGEDYDFTYRAYNCGAVLAYVHGAVAWHDGRDWAGRTESAQQAEQKNREVMMLAARIPEPSMRGHGQIYSVVDVLVDVHTDGWALGAGVVCVRSFLTNLDCAVTIHGAEQSTVDLRAVFVDDPRVRDPRRPGSAAGSSVADRISSRRARLHVFLDRAVQVTPPFARRVMDVLDQDVGTLVVSAHGRPVLTAESSRRRSRIARYPGVAAEAAAAWFSRQELACDEAGLILMSGETKLAATFGGY
jgi:GT2 family glycosyltransferase